MAANPMLSHSVFFTLKESTVETQTKLVAACKQLLCSHPGTVFYASGEMAEDFDRPVNDRDYDVALHVVFENRAYHDQYQQSASHQQFIAENKDNWKQVRVFDAYVQP